MIERDRLKSRAIKSNSPVDWQNYKNAKNHANNQIKKIKAAFYKDHFRTNSGNQQELWRSINDLMLRNTKTDQNIQSIKTEIGNITSPMEISESFNKHFTEIGPKLVSELGETPRRFEEYITPSNSNFNLNLVTPLEVRQQLNNLPANKATGLDKIPCRLVKEAAPIIAESICKIFTCSIVTGVFPSDWTAARVTPIHKTQAKNDLNNYRPISVISPIAKAFERMVYTQLYEYLSINNLLSKYQSGFRRLHSTTTALLDATTEWFLNMDMGKLNSVVFLDLSKAFDTVDHSILLKKLSLYGISQESLIWFSSYLSNRKQQCFVNGHLSVPRTITCGVPQGSILGPLLFLIIY